MIANTSRIDSLLPAFSLIYVHLNELAAIDRESFVTFTFAGISRFRYKQQNFIAFLSKSR